MKVKIKKYPNFYGVYQITEWLKYFISEESLDKVRDWKVLEPWNKFANWRVERLGSKIAKIHIDGYDIWSLDSTLAHIITPSLKLLKHHLHGSPSILDDDDISDELKSEDVFKQWEWIIDEMIFAFESKLEDWEDQFNSGEIDFISIPIDVDGNEVDEEAAKYFRLEHGPNYTFEVDIEGRAKYHKRIANGFRLFGKYYECLWD